MRREIGTTIGGGVLAPEIDEWLGRLAQIPDVQRDFDVDLKRAELEFGFGPDVLDALVARGLCQAGAGDGRRFAKHDLHYIGLRAGCAETYLSAMRLWADSLVASEGVSSATYEVRFTPYARPGTVVELLVAPGRRIAATLGPDRVAARQTVEMPGDWPPFDAALCELLEEVASLDFCFLPDGLRRDVEFARETRLASCQTAACLVVEECAARGIEARTAYGLMLSRPYATEHHWAEVRVDARWIPADPLLLTALADYAGLNSAQWPPTRSSGGILYKLADHGCPIVTTGGRELAASFLTAPLG